MATQSDMNELLGTMARVREFVESRVDVLGEEQKRLAEDVNRVQSKMREVQRSEVQQANGSGYQLVVPSGPYSGFDPIDLALMEGIARSQS